jgi:putative transposase
MCTLYGVTRAGYYAWRARGESTRAEQDRNLLRRINEIFVGSGGTYGSPRIHETLLREGIHVGRRRVERLMRAGGLRGRVVRVYRSNPRLHDFYAQHPNRLRKQRARRADRIWVGDVTYLSVAGKWRYLAVVMDQYSRRVVGWSLSSGRGTRLTRNAFDYAVRRRCPREGLIFHSDRGSEYAGHAYGDRLRECGVRQSMTRGGSPSENAHMESFFHSLKADAIHGRRFADDQSLRACVKNYVSYYNHHRMHSSLGYKTPASYEADVA